MSLEWLYRCRLGGAARNQRFLSWVGAENTTSGRFRVPSVTHHMHSPHLAHRSVIVELRGALERMQGQFKALLPLAWAP
jgi:hypothetical protein